MSQQPKRFSRKPVSWHVLRSLLLICLCATAANSGFFNFRDATNYYSRDVFYRAWSVAYPKEQHEKISVLLMSDQDLGPTGVWPAPYEKHAAALRELMAYKPKALFLDIAFFDERDDETIVNLTEALIALAGTGTKLFIAAASSSSGATRPVRKELAALADRGVLSLVSISVGPPSGINRLYPLGATHDGLLPAAEAMFQALCSSTGSCATLPNIKAFEVWWAAPPSPLNCVTSVDQNICNAISTSPLLRLARLAVQHAAGEYQALAPKESDPIPVPYHSTLYWSEVVSGSLSESHRAHLNGGVILYGTRLAYAVDSVFTGVYGLPMRRELPGVFFHAMALDNLLALKGKVIVVENPFGISDWMHMLLLIVACSSAVLVKGVVFEAMSLRGGTTLSSILLWASDVAVFVGVAIAIAAAEFSWLRISPANWVGVIVAATPMLVAEAGRCTDKLHLGLRRLATRR